MTVQIRPGVAADAEAIAAVAAVSFPLATPPDSEPAAIESFIRDTLSPERFAGYLADPARELLVAEVGDRIVGYAMLIRSEPDDPEVVAALTHRPTVDLNKFYVHPDQHGSGAAAALMGAAVEAARRSGAAALWLGVNQQNDRANRFYEKHGFTVVGTKHFLLGDRFEDDYVRERVL